MTEEFCGPRCRLRFAIYGKDARLLGRQLDPTALRGPQKIAHRRILLLQDDPAERFCFRSGRVGYSPAQEAGIQRKRQAQFVAAQIGDAAVRTYRDWVRNALRQIPAVQR